MEWYSQRTHGQGKHHHFISNSPRMIFTIKNVFIFQKADLAMGSMTINYARESVVDFTKPFMNMGIGILFKVISQ